MIICGMWMQFDVNACDLLRCLPHFDSEGNILHVVFFFPLFFCTVLLCSIVDISSIYRQLSILIAKAYIRALGYKHSSTPPHTLFIRLFANLHLVNLTQKKTINEFSRCNHMLVWRSLHTSSVAKINCVSIFNDDLHANFRIIRK